MLIEKLRVQENDFLDTPEGQVIAPTTYFMEVALNQEESVSVQINQKTYTTLHNLSTMDQVPLAPEYQPHVFGQV